MAVTISVESPLQDDVRALIAALNEHLLTLTPPEFCSHMTVEYSVFYEKPIASP